MSWLGFEKHFLKDFHFNARNFNREIYLRSVERRLREWHDSKVALSEIIYRIGARFRHWLGSLRRRWMNLSFLIVLIWNRACWNRRRRDQSCCGWALLRVCTRMMMSILAKRIFRLFFMNHGLMMFQVVIVQDGCLKLKQMRHWLGFQNNRLWFSFDSWNKLNFISKIFN